MDVKSGAIVPERLDVEQIRDLRSDIRSILKGTREFRFAVDAYDILRYCFPVGPFAGATFRRSLFEHADYAAGLSFIFFHNDLQAILLPEYLDEVHSFVAGFSRHYNGTYGDQELFSTIQNEAVAVAPELTELIRTHATHFEAKDVISRYTSLLLYLSGAEAARLGFTALQRLVIRQLISFTAHDDPRERTDADQVLGRLAREYQPNILFIEQCNRAFESIFESDEHPATDSLAARRNYADAVALDRVIQLNARLDAEEDLPVRQRVYLLSSSVRLQLLIAELTENARWAGTLPYRRSQVRVLRVPDQAFAYVIARPDVREKTDVRATQVLDSLERLIEIFERHKTLGAERHRSPLVDREYHLLQQNVRQVLAPFQDSYENVALFNRLVSVSELMRQLHGSDPLRFPKRGESGQFLRKLIDDASVGAIAREALHTQRELVRFRTILTHRWCVGLPESTTQDITTGHPVDDIRGAFHALPWLVSTPTPGLANVLELTRDAFFLHPDEVGPRRRKLSEAFAALVELDSGGGVESPEDAALDLVRAVLFLALRDDTTEEAALSLARNLAELGPEATRMDAVYVEVWANRRLGKFDASCRRSEYGISCSGEDPRFWHGRALALYARGRAHRNELQYWAIRRDLERALELYEGWSFPSPELRRATIAGCMNSLAYLWTLDVATRDHLGEARSTLKRLKTFLGRDHWEQGFPEFFHTEAYLEVREAEGMPPKSEKWEKKLKNALTVARRARELAPARSLYGELCEHIEDTLRDRGIAP